MNRSLMILLSCLVLVACGGSDGGSDNVSVPGGGSPGDGLDPTAIALDTPPINDQLPADLIPPS